MQRNGEDSDGNRQIHIYSNLDVMHLSYLHSSQTSEVRPYNSITHVLSSYLYSLLCDR